MWSSLSICRSVSASVGESFIRLVGGMIGLLVGCGSGVCSMGRSAIGSLVQFFSRTVGCCVGRSVAWAVDGLVGWLMASLVCGSVSVLVASFVDCLVG